MAKWYLAAVVLGACGFSPTRQVPGDASADPLGDGGTGTPRTCHSSDPTIRLCLDFEDSSLVPTVHDLAPNAHDGAATAVNPMARAGQQAASFATGSSVHVEETPDLDISDHLTYELWIDVLDTSGTLWPFYNNGQYALGVSNDRLFCYANGSYADTNVNLGSGTWHHVACTFGDNRLIAYVDGRQAGCTVTRGTIRDDNTTGTDVGSRFTGGLDDVHVYARSLDAASIAAIAGIAAPTGGPPSCNEGPPRP